MNVMMDAQCQEIEETSRKIENHMKLVFNILNIRPRQLAQESSLCDTEITLSNDIDDARQKRKEQCQVVTPWKKKSMSAGEPKKVEKEGAKANDAKPLYDVRLLSDDRQQSGASTISIKPVGPSFSNPTLVKQESITVDIFKALKYTNEVECHAVKPKESMLGENLALNYHVIKADAIIQKCNAKKIEQQTDVTK
ncbi:hypothetical protein GQ457_12G018320 [Hibiscus cannabinus]